MLEVLVGRQPIYDKGPEVHAYELLFRNSAANRADIVDGDHATASVIMNTFLEIGLEQIVGEHLAFINFTRNLIVKKFCEVLPSDRVVLEVLEDVAADADVVDALKLLAAHGYTIALDDFVYRDDLRPLIETCHMVKLDMLALGQGGMREHVEILRPFNVKLVAEKIDSHEDFEFCKRIGFHYFQGYFLSKPHVVKGHKLSANRLGILRLLAKLQNPNTLSEEVERDISADVELSYKLLRYVNSAVCGLATQISSIRDAVLFVGTNRIKTWASLVLLGGIDDKPRTLLTTALQRAKMSELLAAALGTPAHDRYRFFTAGLFSVLDAMLDKPMDEVLQNLPLSLEINAALLCQTGVVGSVLRCVVAYEKTDWDRVSCPPLTAERIRECYIESIHWATAASSDVPAARPATRSTSSSVPANEVTAGA
jgi:EAL and modified HD-GYP domain-containing signal transduction protein